MRWGCQCQPLQCQCQPTDLTGVLQLLHQIDKMLQNMHPEVMKIGTVLKILSEFKEKWVRSLACCEADASGRRQLQLHAPSTCAHNHCCNNSSGTAYLHMWHEEHVPRSKVRSHASSCRYAGEAR